MRKVRCKMVCKKTETFTDVHQAEFTAVTDRNSENEEFFKYTPGGILTLAVLKDQYFEEGKEYYVDITLAE